MMRRVDHLSNTAEFVLIAFMQLMGTVALFACGSSYRKPAEHKLS
jgi:hypothetical protein